MTENDRSLAGNVAVITGGGSGIGRAVGQALSDRGVICVLVGRRLEVLDEAVAGLATPGDRMAADVTESETHTQIVEHTRREHGRLDMLVHAAGMFEKRPVPETTAEFWDEVIALNLSAVMGLTRVAWPALAAASGQIALISSIAAVQAFPGNAAYAASKGGMNALGGVLGLEGRSEGIRVITIAPGQTATELWEGKAPDAVRAAMMTPRAVGELVVALLGTDRGIDIAPVVIRPVADPWAAASP